MKNKYNWANHLFNFLAVILGVYLAFYINERAKENQDRKESLTLMNSLVFDLSEDITTYEEYQIPENIQHKQNVESLVNSLSVSDIDELESKLPAIFQIENFSPTTTTYISMKSSGKIQLIEDLNLRKNLANYYDGLVVESVEKGEYQVDYFTNELLSWLTVNVDLMNLKLLNNDDLVILRNKLIIYESLIDQKVNSYEILVENSKNLKLSIESILNTK